MANFPCTMEVDSTGSVGVKQAEMTKQVVYAREGNSMRMSPRCSSMSQMSEIIDSVLAYLRR